MPKVKVLFFAKARELASVDGAELDFEPAEATGTQILSQIVRAIPSLEDIKSTCVLALNEEYVDMDGQTVQLNVGDTLAVIPPLSGG
eukprot:m.72626 g.72626  ORF g.72626 m.72626 type:complete len:87 (+) comp24471_c0_seq1:138-398(+)